MPQPTDPAPAAPRGPAPLPALLPEPSRVLLAVADARRAPLRVKLVGSGIDVARIDEARTLVEALAHLQDGGHGLLVAEARLANGSSALPLLAWAQRNRPRCARALLVAAPVLHPAPGAFPERLADALVPRSAPPERFAEALADALRRRALATSLAPEEAVPRPAPPPALPPLRPWRREQTL